MEITIEGPTSQVITVRQLKPEQTVKELMDHLVACTNLGRDQQNLRLDGKRLDPNDTLSNAGVKHGSVLQLSMFTMFTPR